jgi:putative ABC transport system permease protein
MFRNYLKVALRNLRKHSIFSIINIAGLAIGMAACLLILQYVSFQLSFDQFNKNTGDLYRVANDRYQNGKLIQHGTITYSAISKALKDDYPDEVLDNCRVEPLRTTVVSYSDKKLECEMIAVDNSFLTMFSYPMLAGDKLTALKEPEAVMLSETTAKKIFNINDRDLNSVIGKAVVLNRDSMPYKVTGIFADVPENSHLQFDALMSYSSLYSGYNGGYKQADYDFTDSDFWHYILLKKGTDYKALEKKLDAFSERHFQGSKVSGSVEKFHLQPISKAHLYSDYEYEIGKTSSGTVVWSLLAIALFIILIAWVNYVNLSTAKSIERAKEVGVRKVVGALKVQLVRQFLVESLIINIVSLLLAIAIVLLIQPAFNHLLGNKLSLSYIFAKGLEGNTILFSLIGLIVAGILISGFYPAFVLSSFKPIAVLKGKLSTSLKGIALRKALVIGQFAITIALIIGSLVVYRQITFLNKQELGFSMDKLLVLKAPTLTNWDSTFIDRESSFMNELRQIPNIKGAVSSNRVPGNEMSRTFNVRRVNAGADVHFTTRNVGISSEFISLYGMKILAGRNFISTDYNPDWGKLRNIILNEMAVKLLGFKSPNDALGAAIMTGSKQWEIVGVINDFHQKSLRYPMEPTLLIPSYSTYGPITVKVATSLNLPQTIAAIKQKYEASFPGNFFDYYFLDDKFNQQYKDDQLFGKVFAIFSGFAIFIACLGLFGLSLFATLQRVKEIGVRKVLGASISNIVLLLSKDFILLVVVANIIAIPIAWWAMNSWLKDFAYRINISWWIFGLSALLALLIAIATISFQAIKAALANPVKSLRTE